MLKFIRFSVALICLTPTGAHAQSSAGIDAPNNSGIITQGQKGNNFLFQAPPPLPNGLYQYGQLVGSVQEATTDPRTGQVIFQNLRIDSGIVNLTQNLEIQGVTVSCPSLEQPGVQAAHISIAIFGPTTCEIVGKANN
jgi:hypothetical protein